MTGPPRCWPWSCERAGSAESSSLSPTRRTRRWTWTGSGAAQFAPGGIRVDAAQHPARPATQRGLAQARLAARKCSSSREMAAAKRPSFTSPSPRMKAVHATSASDTVGSCRGRHFRGRGGCGRYFEGHGVQLGSMPVCDRLRDRGACAMFTNLLFRKESPCVQLPPFLPSRVLGWLSY